ncbi:hypothetical protein CANMA_000880 [Candida margitis]|uniref:uncharacterized protein n=1 Tax=Candida margitis TaxID=1775924 RepID=UPI0022268916|nr:uncharacterized protein CANMA_000880 [Candida margitis]KAI5970056.1 hypothetical protein CANMA_000880 [Candida margitis]
MVQSNKWDKKAKFQYMKKHGILPSSTQVPATTPKWSGKKKTEKKPAIHLADSDDEWDSEVDEALINHFYPELDSSEELTLQQKVKLKQQILNDLKEKEEQGETSDGSIEVDKSNGQFNIGEIMNNIDRKPKKKLLKARFSENFLEEYGLESYQVSDKEYNMSGRKKGFANLKDDYIIGMNQNTPSSRSLTEEEVAIENERKKKIEQQNFYNEVKKKFGDKSSSQQRVVDINNIKGDDKHLQMLNGKIGKEKMEDTLDADLNELLDLKLSQPEDEVPHKSQVSFSSLPKKATTKTSGVKDVDFLDELLK